ncbi:uncharacterized protein GLRG_06861 [Colletotrichum graminicola M1.001]|uniref:Uncharacterized protein n=1 Tax=Colletotrichum graminicola (strain M1.001 / M2 / FGSC 10212) TaxID=645133 RepID=E3QL34_COLGM|nr:uncharacterized protein GLRG_06861 [Colletotrichum graminicola M1.001]EFQ31572.1 hypothetical protein GLRG_06861 [Colletotrichum graminicola M1.001]
MATRTPSLKPLLRGVLHLIVFALLVETSQARGRDPKKRDERSQALNPIVTTDVATLSLSASERGKERVVTSIITTHILVTLPYDASELPSSLTHQPVTSSTLNGLPTIRDPENSSKQSWNTTFINTVGSASLIKQSASSGDSPGSSSFTSLQENRSTGARSTSFSVPNGGAPSSSPLDSAQGGQPKSGENESSTSAMQASLSEGGTAQTSRVTTIPGQAATSSANSQAVGLPSGSTQVTGNDPFFSSSAAEDSTIADPSPTSVSDSHGTNHDVRTPSMSLSMSGGASTHEPPTTTTGEGQQSSKSSEVSEVNQDKSTKTPEDNDNNKPTTASPGSTRISSATSSSAASPAGQSVSSTSTAGPGSTYSSGPISTASPTSSDTLEYATVPMFATSKPPEGIDPTTIVTWTSTELTKTTTRDGIAWPTIFPVWFCGGGQLLCPPKCLIPFLSCGGLNLPGPRGFPWAKPPAHKPRALLRPPRDNFRVDDKLHHHLRHGHLQADRRLQQDPRHHDNDDLHHTLGHAGPGGALLRRQGISMPELRSQTGRQRPHRPPARLHPPDPGLLDGPKGLTRPEDWPEGPQNWWDRMWRYVYHYCDGLTAPRLTLDGERLEMGYSTMHADVFGDRPLAGATGPFWGCSGVIIVTKRGIYTSHVWEIPNFHKGTHKPTALDWDAEFDEGILQFLKRGSGDRIGGYKGIDQLRRETDIFDNIAQDTLAVILHVPSSMTFAGTSQIPPNYGGFEPRHDRLVGRWADFIADDLGFPRDKIRKNIYVKGPSYWPAYAQERNPLSPMDMYSPPYGLLHWQYHPAHVISTTADGAEVRKPTIRVWYEKFLVFEESWCPPGAVAARDDKSAGSCPMPAAPGHSSPAASGGSASASGSASTPALMSVSASPSASVSTSASIGRGSSSAGSSRTRDPSSGVSKSVSPSTPSLRSSTPSSRQAAASSSKLKITDWRPATPGVIVTSRTKPTSTVLADDPGPEPGIPDIPRIVFGRRSKPLPGSGPGHAPSKRLVQISQEIAFGGDKANHTAVVTVYDMSGNSETVLASERDSKGGGPVDLPSLLTVKDQHGGRLDVRFMSEMQQIELESNRRGRTERWTLTSIQDVKNPDKAYCQVRGVTTGKGVLKRSVDCFYNT